MIFSKLHRLAFRFPRCALRPLRVVAAIVLTPLAVFGLAEEDISTSRRTAVVRAYERVAPSVVSVQVVYSEAVVYRYRDPLFDMLYPMSPYGLRKGERDRISSGSGLIVSADGHILTNDHIIRGSGRIKQVEITLADGRRMDATHVASDDVIDLAILKVEAAGLPVAPLGESGDILVGEWAIAVGNPFALGPSASVGIVSAVDRDWGEPQGKYFYRDMIQTDADINPGNSGGPLANALGEVIGINSFVYTGGSEGIGSIIGFAIPIDSGKKFLDEIKTHGRVRHGWTGIAEIRDITQRQADYLQLPDVNGAIVAQVSVDSPAYLAGVDRLDVIVGINGEIVHSAQDAKGILKGLLVGETCMLDLYRDGERRSIAFTVEQVRQRPY